MAFTEDLSVYFDDFASDITATDELSVEHTVAVLFDAESEFLTNGILTLKPKITVKTADVIGITKDWIFDIEGQLYDVLYQSPDNKGIREIYLTEHVDE